MAIPAYQLQLETDAIGEAEFDLFSHVQIELGKKISEFISYNPELPKTHRFAGLSVERDGDNTIIKANFEPKNIQAQ